MAPPPPVREVAARVVAARDSNRAAVFATAVAAMGLLAIAVDDGLSFEHLLPFEPGTGAVSVLLFVLYGLTAFGPWLRVAAPAGAARVRCGEGVVRVGRRMISAREVAYASVVPAAHGASVAIVLRRGARPLFLEVADLEEGRAIARALGADGAPEAVPAAAPPRGVRAAALALTAVSALTGVLALLAQAIPALRGLHGIGLVNVLFGPFAVVFAAVPRLRAPGRGAFDAHVALHAAAGSGAEAASPREVGGAAALLARKDEDVAAWLARLDALPREGTAYRGDVLSAEALHAVVSDESASPDVRAGAARLLARRHAEPTSALVRVVADPDVRLRVEAALEADPEAATEELERLGPLFRTEGRARAR